MLHAKYQSSALSSFREDFQRFCHSFSYWLPCWLPWQPELWVEFNLLNNFGRASPKEHPCQVSSKLALWFRSRRCLKKLWTTHDGRRTLDDGRRTFGSGELKSSTINGHGRIISIHFGQNWMGNPDIFKLNHRPDGRMKRQASACGVKTLV